MPRIPIYEGGNSAPQARSTSQADAGAFGFNVAPLGQAVENYANKVEENRRIAEKFEITNKIAKGRQQWMLTLQEQRDAVDRGEMSGKGMTAKFMEDYGKWAADTNATMEEGTGQAELDNGLLDLQNSLLPQVQSYESASIAKSLRDNNNSIINNVNGPILAAKSEEEVDKMSADLDTVLNALPYDNKVEAIETIMNTAIDKKAQIRAKLNNPDMSDLTEQAKQLNINKPPGQFINTVERFQQYSDTAKSGLMTAASKSLDNTSILAMQGDLSNDAVANTQSMIDRVNNFDPETGSKLQVMLNNDIDTDNIASSFYRKTPAETSAMVQEMNTQYEAEQDPALKNEMRQRIQKVNQVLLAQRKALQDDLPGVAQVKSPMVQAAYNKRSEMQVGYQNGEITEDQFNEANQEYIAEIDKFANLMKVPNYNYLPKQEATALAESLNDALRKEQGSTDAVQTIFTLRSQYGDAFPRVMQQIAATDSKLQPLAIVPMLDGETGRRLVEAVNSSNLTPDLYKVTPTDKTTAMGSVTTLMGTMRENGMLYQSNTMLDAAMLLNKHEGKAASDSSNISKLLSDRFTTYNGNVFPVASDIAPREIYIGSIRIVKDSDGKDVVPLVEGETTATYEDLKQLPIKFKNSPSEDALVLYWPGTDKPVKLKDGSTFKVPFKDAQQIFNMKVPTSEKASRKYSEALQESVLW
jgi:hypothetical protein